MDAVLPIGTQNRLGPRLTNALLSVVGAHGCTGQPNAAAKLVRGCRSFKDAQGPRIFRGFLRAGADDSLAPPGRGTTVDEAPSASWRHSSTRSHSQVKCRGVTPTARSISRRAAAFEPRRNHLSFVIRPLRGAHQRRSPRPPTTPETTFARKFLLTARRDGVGFCPERR